MAFSVSLVALALNLSAGAGGPAATEVHVDLAGTAAVIAAAPLPLSQPAIRIEPMAEAPFGPVHSRSGALPAMYVTLGAVQALDVYSTRRAVGAGATELNPVMQRSARSTAAMTAMKAVATAATIYFVERAAKKNRRGAIVLVGIINGVTAAIAVRNLRHAQ